MFRLGRRLGRQTEVWLYLNLPGIDPLQLPVHPDTDLYNVDSEKFTAGGLTFDLLHPMLRWKITYSGQLRYTAINEMLAV